jgi:hypothetical protein
MGEAMSMTPTIGLIFAHRRIFNEDVTIPVLYQVTQISDGIVFYRPLDTGNTECVEVKKFNRVAKEE